MNEMGSEARSVSAWSLVEPVDQADAVLLAPGERGLGAGKPPLSGRPAAAVLPHDGPEGPGMGKKKGLRRGRGAVQKSRR